jgi:hypothetical protein
MLSNSHTLPFAPLDHNKVIGNKIIQLALVTLTSPAILWSHGKSHFLISHWHGLSRI